MYLPNIKLISNILNIPIDYIHNLEFSPHNKFLKFNNDFTQETEIINIYELANLAKSWALKENFEIKTFLETLIDEDNIDEVATCIITELTSNGFNTSFHSKNEAFLILEACEVILNLKVYNE